MFFSVEGLNTLLNAKERAIKKRSSILDPSSMAMAANYQSQGFGRGGRNNQKGRGGRGNFNGGYNSSGGASQFSQSNQSRPPGLQGQSNQNQRPQCQICGKNGHVALDCYHRMDFAFQGKHAPSKLAAMVANSSQVHGANGWLTATSCSDHATPDLANLSLRQQPTSGFETVTVGNGQELPVTHIGNGELCTSSYNFKLDGILRVPDLAYNLPSIHKLCLQNNAFCYFDAYRFSI